MTLYEGPFDLAAATKALTIAGQRLAAVDLFMVSDKARYMRINIKTRAEFEDDDWGDVWVTTMHIDNGDWFWDWYPDRGWVRSSS